MNNEVTYQGLTLETLTKGLNYVNFALSHELELWERKEFEAVKKDYEFKIKRIKSNPLYKA